MAKFFQQFIASLVVGSFIADPSLAINVSYEQSFSGRSRSVTALADFQQQAFANCAVPFIHARRTPFRFQLWTVSLWGLQHGLRSPYLSAFLLWGGIFAVTNYKVQKEIQATNAIIDRVSFDRFTYFDQFDKNFPIRIAARMLEETPTGLKAVKTLEVIRPRFTWYAGESRGFNGAVDAVHSSYFGLLYPGGAALYFQFNSFLADLEPIAAKIAAGELRASPEAYANLLNAIQSGTDLPAAEIGPILVHEATHLRKSYAYYSNWLRYWLLELVVVPVTLVSEEQAAFEEANNYRREQGQLIYPWHEYIYSRGEYLRDLCVLVILRGLGWFLLLSITVRLLKIVERRLTKKLTGPLQESMTIARKMSEDGEIRNNEIDPTNLTILFFYAIGVGTVCAPDFFVTLASFGHIINHHRVWGILMGLGILLNTVKYYSAKNASSERLQSTLNYFKAIQHLWLSITIASIVSHVVVDGEPLYTWVCSITNGGLFVGTSSYRSALNDRLNRRSAA